MPQYVIEREMPGAYVTDNKIFCIYRAPNEDMIREHAQRGGFPCNKISQVRKTIDPTTAE